MLKLLLVIVYPIAPSYCAIYFITIAFTPFPQHLKPHNKNDICIDIDNNISVVNQYRCPNYAHKMNFSSHFRNLKIICRYLHNTIIFLNIYK